MSDKCNVYMDKTLMFTKKGKWAQERKSYYFNDNYITTHHEPTATTEQTVFIRSFNLSSYTFSRCYNRSKQSCFKCIGNEPSKKDLKSPNTTFTVG